MVSFTKRLSGIVATLALIVSTTYMQIEQQPDLSNDLVKYIGFYVFNYPKCRPPMFEKVRWVRIENLPDQDIDHPRTDSNGLTIVNGYIETIDDERLKFKKASLKKNRLGNYEDLEVETEKLNGVHFTLKGSFLKKSANEGGTYTVMRGSLLKYKNGEPVASIELAPFSKYAEL